jgi:hypothetical protein
MLSGRSGLPTPGVDQHPPRARRTTVPIRQVDAVGVGEIQSWRRGQVSIDPRGDETRA